MKRVKLCPCGVPVATKDSAYCSPACRNTALVNKANSRYADPVFKAKHQAGVIARSQRADWRASQREGSKRRSQDPNYLKKLVDATTSPEYKERWREAMIHTWKRGDKHPSWKGTQTERQLAYGRQEYTDWRAAVFCRDDYTCQHCKKRGGSLHAHHIEGWGASPDLRYVIKNGTTLCADCHSTVHGHYIPGRYRNHRK